MIYSCYQGTKVSRQILLAISDIDMLYFISLSSSQTFKKILFKCLSLATAVSWLNECSYDHTWCGYRMMAKGYTIPGQYQCLARNPKGKKHGN